MPRSPQAPVLVSTMLSALVDDFTRVDAAQIDDGSVRRPFLGHFSKVSTDFFASPYREKIGVFIRNCGEVLRFLESRDELGSGVEHVSYDFVWILGESEDDWLMGDVFFSVLWGGKY